MRRRRLPRSVYGSQHVVGRGDRSCSGGTAITLRWIDKRPWSDVWLDRPPRETALARARLRAWCGVIGLPILGSSPGDGSHVPSGGGSWWAARFGSRSCSSPAALLEELMTRGYILSVLRDWWGWRWAIGATSVGFGLTAPGEQRARPPSRSAW